MHETIYITIDNSIQSPDTIRGIAYTKENALALCKEDTDDVVLYPIEDSRMSYYDGDVLDTCSCKYYKPKLKAIVIMIHALYEMEGCGCGGICHVILDNDNYDDHTIECVLKDCQKEENQDKLEIELAEAICKALLKLSMQERALIFSGFYSSYLCDMNNRCNKCSIEKGRVD